ncbi:hypothetical protein RvY_04352 [Ramazzottius varieornatus]|uniref:Receptor ligand binding region domain-containing protein n=1 Tax=Ramazzottius varieornatus TaxID=947166 RepID=A0A1D1V1D5_RAMVA|nr:hypothetical protein RvY_04352 [Ramazzottius varieornatus]
MWRPVAIFLVCTAYVKVQGVQIMFVAMAAGGRNVQVGYEVIGSAYDVAMDRARRLYPRVYQDVFLTRYFIPGRYSCEEAVGITTAGLGLLFRRENGDQVSERRKQEASYFRIILTPGCTFEMFTLADFAREEGVTVFGSTASINMRNLQWRFPTFFPWSAIPYGNAASAILTLMRLYKWKRFNLVCDTSSSTPFTYVFEVSCNLFQQISLNFRDLNMRTLKFDSSNNTTILPMLKQCRASSTVTVVASVPDVYKNVLWIAASQGMSTGDYASISGQSAAFSSHSSTNRLTSCLSGFCVVPGINVYPARRLLLGDKSRRGWKTFLHPTFHLCAVF